MNESNKDNESPRVWLTQVVDAGDGSGDCLLLLPDGMVAALGWKISDTFEISVGPNSEIVMKRVAG